MDVQAPSAQTTLLILLGASAWPYSPEFQSSEAFSSAARRVKAYFLNPRPFGLPTENLLDLFDSNQSPDELDVAIGQFLEQRLAALKNMSHPVRDLLVYFIGHGGFVGRDADFYLAIRRTRMDNPRASGLQMMALADTLSERARHLRRILILDCCFAAAAFSAFQAGPDQVALEKTVDAFKVSQKAVGFPTKGTTLLCSSSHKSPSLLLPDGSSTMFTKAFLDTLVQGTTVQRERLSLRDVKDAAADLLYGVRNAPRPVVLSPDQSEGDVADIPFFPNSWMEKQRLQRIEEEKPRQVEEIREAEEERQNSPVGGPREIAKAEETPKAEEERQRDAEEKRVRKEGGERRPRAMEEEKLFQLSGWALIVSSVIGIVQAFLNAFLSLSSNSDNGWWELNGLLTVIWLILISLALPGLHIKQAGRARQIGIIAIVMIIASNLGFMVGTILGLLRLAGNSNIGQYDALNNISNLVSLVGILLLGIAIVRASIFPRWTGIVLILTAITQVLYFTPLPAILSTLGIIATLTTNSLPFSVAVVGCGRVLLLRQKVVPDSILVSTATKE